MFTQKKKKKKGSSDSGISRQERILVACFSGKRGWVEFPKKPDEQKSHRHHISTVCVLQSFKVNVYTHSCHVCTVFCAPMSLFPHSKLTKYKTLKDLLVPQNPHRRELVKQLTVFQSNKITLRIKRQDQFMSHTVALKGTSLCFVFFAQYNLFSTVLYKIKQSICLK